jgi:pre-mRNA-splicing factor ISY1
MLQIPRPTVSSTPLESLAPATAPASSKRKATDGETPSSTMDDDDTAKRSRKEQNGDAKTKPNASTTTTSETAMLYARTVAGHVAFLDVESLLPPKLPTREEMEGVLLALRKRALVEEYFGDGG